MSFFCLVLFVLFCLRIIISHLKSFSCRLLVLFLYFVSFDSKRSYLVLSTIHLVQTYHLSIILNKL